MTEPKRYIRATVTVPTDASPAAQKISAEVKFDDAGNAYSDDPRVTFESFDALPVATPDETEAEKWERADTPPKTLHEAAAYLTEFQYYHSHFHDALRAVCEAVRAMPDQPVEIAA